MNKKSIMKKFLLFISVFVFTAVLASPCCLAADAEFEKSISSFPESYQPALRALHEKHPEWTFAPLITGLDWSSAINGEYKDNLSLVTNDSAYTDIFKSREAGDYNSTTGKYIEKDYGFVKANKLAISYYMDPRNFLTEEGIFQFEDHSFNTAITIESVEHVLKGSFMENKYISYLDQNGNTVNTNEKYSQVIYQAGKLYNANPCFLAAKIISEVGKNGSGSVSGNYGSYPGIYNFYNIGANDNPSGAISGGLKWASSGTTYQRPWNTPKKSIYGGAQYIAEKYISKGQQTGYLQRFNVNPKASYDVYTHQYMTNLSGAAIPAYSNYTAYRASGMLDLEFIFLIPVYKNMPGYTNTDGYVKAADSYNQSGAFSTANSAYNIRKGPST
ncbi:MAG: N-acetylglucosaminidase, partial [Acutalibacteraceae bacterium]